MVRLFLLVLRVAAPRKWYYSTTLEDAYLTAL